MRRTLTHRPALQLLVLCGAALIGWSCASSAPKPLESVSKGWTEKGIASWYGSKFHGRRTANGEVYDMNKISAAHKQLTFGTHVRVDNLSNGASLVVRINDRGPFVRGRIIDVSYGAAKKLGMVETGVVPVRLTVVSAGEAGAASKRRRGPSARYRIQVGAFRERQNAESLLAEGNRCVRAGKNVACGDLPC